MKYTIPDWLAQLADECSDPTHGFYGPDSAQWLISREQVLFLGGLRALLMQIAHPAIADAGRAHSNFYADPWARFDRTFEIVHAMVFGSKDEAIGAAVKLWTIHQRISGTLPAGTPGVTELNYKATDPDLLFWVYATLVDSTFAVGELALPQVEQSTWDQLYEESKIFAQLCGVRPENLPATRADFDQRMADIISSDLLAATPDSVHIKNVLLTASPLLRLLQPYNRTVAAGLLPEQLREAFGLSWRLQDQWGSEVNWAVWRRVLPLMPTRMRFVPAYLAALERCGVAEQPLGVQARARLGAVNQQQA